MERVRATRRRHSPEVKRRILEACDEPGASVARIAMENGLNANLVHKWRRSAAGDAGSAREVLSTAEFVSLPVLTTPTAMPVGDIRVSIRRGGTTVDIQWPLSGAESCAQWLRELLR